MDRKNRTPLLAALLATSLLVEPAIAGAAVAETEPAAEALPSASVETSLAAAKGKILLQADEATFDAATGIYTARGHVEAHYGGRTLVAEELSYDQRKNEVIAAGGVTITDEGGTTLHAGHVVLDGALKSGLIETFGLLIDENTRLAGRTATRTEEKTEVTQAVYSPCSVCADERDGQPVWQIKALRVTHDHEKKTISYRHAYLEILGVPVLYTPYFWHPDPTIKRQSGFLVPNAGNSTDFGNFIEVPYYWALAPNYDLTLAPLIMSEEAPLLKSEFRMRTNRGEFRLEGSITNPDRRDANGNPTSGREIRDHFFGHGRFSYNDDWDWGFDVRLASDDTYLKRYDILPEVDELRSHGFVHTSFKRSYTHIDSYFFQGLRSTDEVGQTPIVVPSIDMEYHLKDPYLEGHVILRSNFLSLQRTEGADMLRFSLEGDWERPFISPGGQVFNLFANLRTDFYHTKDRLLVPGTTDTNNVENAFRVLPTIGAEWRFPLARPTTRGYQVIEPIAQIAASPAGLNPDDIPNEDSLSFEFDDTNLFRANKFPGFDRWEEGLRMNVGVRAALVGYGPGENSITFGQTFRADETTLFDAATGLNDRRSDYVGRIVLTPLSQLRMIHRFRMDKEDLSFRRNEVDLHAGGENYWLEAGYLRLSEELSESGLDAREELSAKTHLKIRGNWALEAQGIRNLALDEMIRASASIVYRDECTDFEITARRRFTEDRDIEPATSIFFRVRLKSLG